jgi:UDP-glucose 4-epimerase
VFHLAAYAAEGLSHFIRRFNYTNNLIGSVNLINASIKYETVKCFVFTSSIAVYGTNQVPMKEETMPKPEDPYGISKYAVELDLKSAHEMFGLNYIVFRPHNVYGSKQNIGDPYRNVVGIFMNQILQNKPLTIFGDGKQTRAFSHITDVAPVIAESINRRQCYNEIFNVGADYPYTILELAEAVCSELGVNESIVHLESRNEVVHAHSSHDKVKEHFGDVIKNIDLKEGVKEMAEWVRRTGARKGERFSDIEVNRNMPALWRTL